MTFHVDWKGMLKIIPFGCNVARSATACVKEIRIIGWIIFGQICWLEWSKIGQQNPIPRCDQNIFQLKSKWQICSALTEFNWMSPTSFTFISPWHIFCLWHWCRAHSTWNVIHFFSNDVRNGLVDTRSYKLCFTYSRITSAAFSVNYNIYKIVKKQKQNVFEKWVRVRSRTTTRWNGKQLTAFDKLRLMNSSRSACVSSGRLGSCLTNTLTTTNPSSERTRATLKNRVLPMLLAQMICFWLLLHFLICRRMSCVYFYLDSYCKSDSNDPIK